MNKISGYYWVLNPTFSKANAGVVPCLVEDGIITIIGTDDRFAVADNLDRFRGRLTPPTEDTDR